MLNETEIKAQIVHPYDGALHRVEGGIFITGATISFITGGVFLYLSTLPQHDVPGELYVIPFTLGAIQASIADALLRRGKKWRYGELERNYDGSLHKTFGILYIIGGIASTIVYAQFMLGS